MTLPATSTIEAGTSILFLGAGFSAEATNISNDSIKDVDSLISYFLEKVGISSSDGYDLDTAAEEFQKVHGDAKTITALHSNFRARAFTADQEKIVCQPWRRIYTTNYDDVIELICSSNHKPITTHEVNDPVSPPMPGTTQLIHIYGNIGKASADQFAKTFLLTERQRDNSPFLTSSWFRAFHNDVLAASSVVFVGFSVSDLDIRRLLGMLPSDVKAKIHFITRPTTRQPILTRMSKFGEPHAVGLASFAAHLHAKRPGLPTKVYSALPVEMLEVFFKPQMSASISATDIERLLLSGAIDLEKLSQADISAGPGSYTISRSTNAYQRAGNNASSTMPILVHSEIGNGKTVFADHIGYQYAQKHYRIFKIQREPENIGDVLAYVQALEGPALLIFDDIMRFRKLPGAILEMKKSDVIVLATVRSVFLDTNASAVRSRLGNVTAIEIDLDSPMREENLRTVAYLTTNGLLGRYADLSEPEKLAFVERTCGGQLRDVVLSLYESGSLHQKVQELLINVQKLDKGDQDLIIFSAMLTQAGYQELSELWVLTELLDYSGAFESLKTALTEHELSGLVDLGRGYLSIRSPALGEFILKRVFNLERTLGVVARALQAIDNYHTDEEDLLKMAKGLLKFSVYARIIKSNAENKYVEDFYDKCRVLSFAANDPLFWVQRSICSMHAGNFDICYRFIENAYGLAKGRVNWDSYQIDNHKARVMLVQSRETGVSKEGEREQEAIALLQAASARKNDDQYHPLSVMRVYAEIIEKYSDTLSAEQRAALKKSADAALTSIGKFKQPGRFKNLVEVRSRLVNASRLLS